MTLLIRKIAALGGSERKLNVANLSFPRRWLLYGVTIGLTCLFWATLGNAGSYKREITAEAVRETFTNTVEQIRQVSARGDLLGEWALLQAQKGDLSGSYRTSTAVAKLVDEEMRAGSPESEFLENLKVQTLLGIAFAYRQSGHIVDSQLLLEMARNGAQTCMAAFRYVCLEKILVTAVRSNETEMANQAFEQIVEAVQFMPGGDELRESRLLGVMERRVSLELSQGHVLAAKQVLSDAMTRVQMQSAPTIKWHLANLAPKQIALGDQDGAEESMQEVLALREQVLLHESNQDELAMLTRHFAFYKVAEYSSLASAYGLVGSNELGLKKLKQALDSLVDVDHEDQGFAWGEILKAAATLEKDEVITRGAGYAQNGRFSDSVLGEILDRLVARGKEDLAQTLAVRGEVRGMLAEAFAKAGNEMRAEEIGSKLDLDDQPQTPDRIRLLARVHAKLRGADSALEWSQHWKSPSTRAYVLLGILDQLVWKAERTIH